MPRSNSRMFKMKLIAAMVFGMGVPSILGPGDQRYNMFIISLGMLILFGSYLRKRYSAGGIMGQVVVGAWALLLFSPAVGIRVGRVADAIFTATHIAPHEALFQVPAIAQTVPDASGPLLLGAGVALLIMAGKLGATYAGIAFAAATAAWGGHTLAYEAGRAMRAEHFDDAVLYAQSMRFVGFIVIVGAVAGHLLVRRGREEWLKENHARMVAEEIERIRAEREKEKERLRAEQAAAAAALAEQAKEAGENAEGEQGAEEAAGAPPQATKPEEEAKPEDEAKPEEEAAGPETGGGFSEEDGEIEADDDDDDDQVDVDADTDEVEHPDAAEEEVESEEGEEGEEGEESQEGEEDEEGEESQEGEEGGVEPEPEPEPPIVVDIPMSAANPDLALTPETLGQQNRISWGITILACLVAGWTATPPWFSIINAMPYPGTDIAVPQTEPGLSIAREPMDPMHRDFATHVEKRGHPRNHGPPWSCLPDTYDVSSPFGTRDRATEAVAAPGAMLLVDLYPAIQILRQRGVYRMSLTGRADPPYGPLGSFFAWPAVHLLLDRPPRSIQWMRLHPRQLEELPLLPGAVAHQACAILVERDVTVSQLYSTARSLSSSYGSATCKNGIALVMPDDVADASRHPAWQGCP